jgi:Fe-S cluster biogenesis protein NfuA
MNNINFTIEKTNSPSIIKFVSNAMLTRGTHEFENIEEASGSPLTQKLFEFPFINKIQISANFIAIESVDNFDWEIVQDDVLEFIQNFINEDIKDSQQQVMYKDNVLEIYMESTPNPNTMKFATNRLLAINGATYASKDEAEKSSELAKELFNFDYITEIFISENYVSVTKDESKEWNEIQAELREFIKSFINSGKEIIKENLSNQSSAEIHNYNELDDTSKQIIAILEKYVKPAVASDGGNIVFHSYDSVSKQVSVILQGACNGCPSSTVTLKNGIEDMLKQMIPNKIEKVKAING